LFAGNAFYAAGFTNYRVHSARLKVTSVCGATGDTCNFWMYPTPANIVNARFQEAQDVPGFKTMMVTGSCRPLTCVSTVKCHQVLGLTPQEYMDSPNTSGTMNIGSPPSSGQVQWTVYYSTLDGAVTTGQVYFNFEIEYEVEFFTPLVQTN